jgi:neopullulanase
MRRKEWVLSLLVLLFWFSAEGISQPGVAPVINKIDPPNWWATLPDPVLLVYGRNLKDAQFAVEGRGVRLGKTQASANGQYAFLWVAAKDAPAQKLRIRAANAAGSVSADFELKARVPEAGRYQGFSGADVMYLIMTDRFADGDALNNQPGYDQSASHGWHGGDLRGVDQHLDYLQQLGVTTLWLTPILSNARMTDSYHGYAATDLYAVDSHFGTLSDYLNLVNDLHARGMKIVYDIVPNHIGVEHEWVRDQPTPEWLHGTVENHAHAKYNMEALADPHAAPANWWDITHGWFVDAMPDLNQENPLVTTYWIQNAIWWIETAGLDGLRIDTLPYVGRAFWSEFHRQIKAVYPKLTTVGEVFNGDPAITSYFAGGVEHEGIDTGLYTPFDFPTYFKLRDVLTHDKPMTDLAGTLGADHLYPHPERLVTFFGNHDTKRFLSETGASPERLKLAFALLATMRGMPEVYSGDEIGMEGGDDPDNRRDFPGGFKNSSHDAFTEAGRTVAEREIFAWSSGLFRLRKGHEAFATGDEQDVAADATAFAFLRGRDLSAGCKANGAERMLVVVSKAAEARSVEIAATSTGLANCTQFKLVFSAGAHDVKLADGKASMEIGANGVAIYSVR